MEFSTVLVAIAETVAIFGPFLLPMMGLYWLINGLKLWDVRYDTDEVLAYLIGGLAMMYLAVDYSIGVIRAPESGALQVFAVIVTGCCVIIFLHEIYLRVRAFIKARRASN